MIKTIIFDFDGVIAESLEVKTEAFRELVKDYPQHVDAFVAFHQHNGGVSRYEKIRYLFEHLLKRPLTDNELLVWCNRYSQLVVQKVIDAPLVNGADELLKKCLGKYTMFVVSGTPQDEMRTIVTERGLDKFFQAVYGSPDKKTDIVEKILSVYNINPKEALFVGDAKTDMEAAQKFDIGFIARMNGFNENFFEGAELVAKVQDMAEVSLLLDDMEKRLIRS